MCHHLINYRRMLMAGLKVIRLWNILTDTVGRFSIVIEFLKRPFFCWCSEASSFVRVSLFAISLWLFWCIFSFHVPCLVFSDVVIKQRNKVKLFHASVNPSFDNHTDLCPVYIFSDRLAKLFIWGKVVRQQGLPLPRRDNSPPLSFLPTRD